MGCELPPVIDASAGAQEPFRLKPGHVHVWLASLDDAAADEAVFDGSLSDEERGRARQLLFAPDRRRFLLSHLVLRGLLGRYLARHPSAIHLTHGPWGKPRLVDPVGIDFNLAHSGGLAAYAFGRDRQVGIDIERIRPMLSAMTLADRYFTQFEAQALEQTSDAERTALFFSYWVRKEAVLKASGYGLHLSLRSVEVAGDQRQTRGVIARLPDGASATWQIVDLLEGGEYRAAVAVDRPPRGLSCRRISSEFLIGYC